MRFPYSAKHLNPNACPRHFIIGRRKDPERRNAAAALGMTSKGWSPVEEHVGDRSTRHVALPVFGAFRSSKKAEFPARGKIGPCRMTEYNRTSKKRVTHPR